MTSSPMQAFQEQDTGVLIHGRHLESEDINRLLWGTPDFERHLGVVPTAVLAMLNAGPERLNVLTIGSGASMRGPIRFEAQVIYDVLSRRFDELDKFRPIREHPAWINRDRLMWLGNAVIDAQLDLRAQSTRQEIENAAKLFEERGVTNVIQVTNRDHGMRCLNEQNQAREEEIIPVTQQWSVVTDDESYWNGLFVPPVVAEPPHRGDDPSAEWDPALWTPSLMQRLIDLGPDARHRASFLIEYIISTAEQVEASNPPKPDDTQ